MRIWKILFAVAVVLGLGVSNLYAQDINAVDEEGYTPLLRAIKNKADITELEKLLEQGADVNAEVQEKTAIWLAVEYLPKAEVIDLLVKYGGKVDAPITWNVTPLMSAVEYANYETVEALIRNGADVNVQDESKYTPLIRAIGEKTNPDIIRLLLKNGADVNYVGISYLEPDFNQKTLNMEVSYIITPLLKAVQYSTAEVVEILLNAGADVKVKDKFGKTALDYAKENPDIRQSDVYQRMKNMIAQ